MGLLQGTVARAIEIVGVGLYSGRLVELMIYPAEPMTGIRFLRTDSEGSQPVWAHPSQISSTTLCTTIGVGPSEVSTIEHLMAAFVGLGVDNALVYVNANEIPILDGSAAPFVDRLLEAGIQRQPVPRRILSLPFPFTVQVGDQSMRYTPIEKGAKRLSLSVDYTIDFPRSQAIGRQSVHFELDGNSFAQISEARTFCHIDDVTAMRERGLALGGSLDNAVVVNDTEVINRDGLRCEDEFVRHKVLDCIGDLGLLGGQLVGHIVAFKAGHHLHAEFTKQFLSHYEALAAFRAPLVAVAAQA